MIQSGPFVLDIPQFIPWSLQTEFQYLGGLVWGQFILGWAHQARLEDKRGQKLIPDTAGE
jgi:hypothetical protein